MPVHKLIGSYRDKVPAYGTIMCGDELEGGLATPEDYGRFAEKLVARGYKGIKLHTWMPPVSWAPDVRMDLKACAAVREAVGPDIHLMIDAYHWYSRTEALELGRGLEKLGFAWFEEPLDEQSMSTYAWLAAEPRHPGARAGERARASTTPAPSGSRPAPATSCGPACLTSAASPRR